MTSRKCCYGYKVTSRKCCYGYKVTRNKTPKTYTCQYYLPDAGFMKLVNDRRYFVLVLHTELHSNQAVSVGSTTDRNLCKRILIYIQQRCNITQFIYIWKPLYIFRVVPPPIIRSANNCIYSIWYLSHRYCYLLCWFECAVGGVRHPQHTQTSTADSNNGVTNTRYCRYSCLRS